MTVDAPAISFLLGVIIFCVAMRIIIHDLQTEEGNTLEKDLRSFGLDESWLERHPTAIGTVAGRNVYYRYETMEEAAYRMAAQDDLCAD